MKKMAVLLILTTMLALMIGGCSKDVDGEWKPFGKEEQATLKVMYWDEKSFYDDYGMMFQSEYPNVEFEVFGLPFSNDPSIPVTQVYETYIEQNQLDVMLMTPDHQWLARGGKLLDLDPLIERYRFDLGSYFPAVVSMLRHEGDGKLYGLSPNFSSYGLYYNLDLFKEYGIEPPGESMTWEEVFELAKRFPTDGDEDDRIYGFTIDGFSTPLSTILFGIAAQNRKMLNSDGTEVRLDTESWKKTFEQLVSVMRSGAVYRPTPEEQAKKIRSLEDRRFLNGKAAMTYDLEYLVNSLNKSSINWGVAAAPADPLNRTQSSAYGLGQTFVISKNTQNARAAWEFVRYVNSDEFAQIKSKASLNVLFSRTEFIRPQGERDISALYKLEPTGDYGDEFSSYDPRVRMKVVQVIENELLAVIDNAKTLDEAIEAMQEQGTAALVQARSVSMAP